MLIPFLMFSLDSVQGKVKYSPLYGRGSKVTILVGRHFQSEMLPIAIFNQKCCQSKHITTSRRFKCVIQKWEKPLDFVA